MGRIVLSGMEFHGYHGVFDEEIRFGARFVVDVELQLPLSGTDELGATVDYSRVYDLVRTGVTTRRYRLIEALAHSLVTAILAAEPHVTAVTVRVHKPHAPLPGLVKDVYVELHRAR
jgi:dihydroneopterin aldolase